MSWFYSFLSPSPSENQEQDQEQQQEQEPIEKKAFKTIQFKNDGDWTLLTEIHKERNENSSSYGVLSEDQSAQDEIEPEVTTKPILEDEMDFEKIERHYLDEEEDDDDQVVDHVKEETQESNFDKDNVLVKKVSVEQEGKGEEFTLSNEVDESKKKQKSKSKQKKNKKKKKLKDLTFQEE